MNTASHLPVNVASQPPVNVDSHLPVNVASHTTDIYYRHILQTITERASPSFLEGVKRGSDGSIYFQSG